MDISLIIPTHRRLNGVMNLLSSISRQELGPLKIEVVVVSNLHDEDLQSAITQLPSQKFPITYFSSGRIGVNQARNVGIDHSKSDLVLFLDDDVSLGESDFLQKCHSYALKHPEAAAIGGRYILPSKVNNCDEAYFNISDSWLSHGKSDDNSAIHLVGGNTLYNKKVLGHRLRFNENITFGGAETELNLKIFQANFPIKLFDDIGLIHATNLTPRKMLKKAFYQGMGRAYHELVVHPQIWMKPEIADPPERHELIGSKWNIFWQSLFILWFDLFFRIGYRQAKLSNFAPVSRLFVLKCALIEIFDLDPNKLIYRPSGAKEYTLFSAIKTKVVNNVKHVIGLIPFWRIPWFFRHVIGTHLWRLPWFLKWKIFSRTNLILSRLWLIPWFFKHKLTPWVVSLFSGFWRIPWFMRWRILIRLKAFVGHLWKIPWFLRHRLYPVIPFLLSQLWLIPWLIRWKIIYPLLFVFRLPWWRLPWFIRHKFLAHFWFIPWFVKWRVIPVSLFFAVFTISMFFPVNTIGLATFYAATLRDLERFIKKPWSQY